jgi:hypothetical protein
VVRGAGNSNAQNAVLTDKNLCRSVVVSVLARILCCLETLVPQDKHAIGKIGVITAAYLMTLHHNYELGYRAPAAARTLMGRLTAQFWFHARQLTHHERSGKSRRRPPAEWLIRIPFISPTIRNRTGLPAPCPEPVSLLLASARIERALQPIQS